MASRWLVSASSKAPEEAQTVVQVCSSPVLCSVACWFAYSLTASRYIDQELEFTHKRKVPPPNRTLHTMPCLHHGLMASCEVCSRLGARLDFDFLLSAPPPNVQLYVNHVARLSSHAGAVRHGLSRHMSVLSAVLPSLSESLRAHPGLSLALHSAAPSLATQPLLPWAGDSAAAASAAGGARMSSSASQARWVAFGWLFIASRLHATAIIKYTHRHTHTGTSIHTHTHTHIHIHANYPLRPRLCPTTVCPSHPHPCTRCTF